MCFGNSWSAQLRYTNYCNVILLKKRAPRGQGRGVIVLQGPVSFRRWSRSNNRYRPTRGMSTTLSAHACQCLGTQSMAVDTTDGVPIEIPSDRKSVV